MKSNQQSVWAWVGKSINQQGYLGFEMMVNQANVVSPGVKRLNRFNRENLVDLAWQLVFPAPAREAGEVKVGKVGGALREVGYSSWLAFYSPLSSRGN